MGSPRNIYIAIAVMAAIFFGGGLALRQVGGTALQIVPIAGMIAGFVVLHALDCRDRRRERANQKVA
jgi:ABC-type iron transport system FetAB permease component